MKNSFFRILLIAILSICIVSCDSLWNVGLKADLSFAVDISSINNNKVRSSSYTARVGSAVGDNNLEIRIIETATNREIANKVKYFSEEDIVSETFSNLTIVGKKVHAMVRLEIDGTVHSGKSEEKVMVKDVNYLTITLQEETPLAGIYSYYVSDTNASDDNDGTEAAPFESVQRAVEVIQENTRDEKNTEYYIYISGTIVKEGTVNAGENGIDDGMIEIESEEELHITLLGLDDNNKAIIDAENAKRVLYIGGKNTTVTLSKNITLTGGNAAATGGAGVRVQTDATFKMTGGEIIGNSSSKSGGGVFVNFGSFEMSGGVISDNDASMQGGGVFLFDGSVVLSGVAEVCDNTALDSGGGIYIESGILSLKEKPRVAENKVGGTQSNVFFYNNASSPITVVADLTGSAKSIGLSPSETADGTVVVNSDVSSDSEGKFFIDNGGSLYFDVTTYEIKKGSGSITPPSPFTYIDDGTGNLTVTGYTGADAEVVIPSAIGVSTVASIGENAFLNNTVITKMTIPDSVTSLGMNAFRGCVNLQSVNIPTNVTRIGDYAFEGCNKLENIEIPNKVSYIGAYAFSKCASFTTVVIPDSVKTLGNFAFSYCSGLSSVSIPSSVATIKASTFNSCTSLSSIVIPENVTSIEMAAFGECSNLSAVTIPDSMESIEMAAFSGCAALATVHTNFTKHSDGSSGGIRQYPSSWTTGYNQSFFIDAEWVSIPSNLDDFTVYESEPHILYEYKGTDEHVVIPSSFNGTKITEIENHAFAGNSTIKTVIIPDGVQIIDSQAFYNCASLAAIQIPKSVTTINGNAFYASSALKTVYTDVEKDLLPSGWNMANNEAFFNNTTWLPISANP